MERLKILHIIKSLGRGGAEMLLPETLKLHDKDKFEFHYLYFLPWKDQVVKNITDAGGIVHCFPAHNNLTILLQYRKIIHYVKANGIQIIHCHLPWAGFVGRMIRKSVNVPVMYTEHNLQERYHRLTYWLNKWTFNNQDVVLAVSEDVSFSIHSNISPKIPVKVVFNGVNTETFRRDEISGSAIRQELKIPEGTIVVGIVTVFRFQKRLKEWLEIFSAVSKKHPNVFGIIAGDGPLREEVEQLIKDLGLENRISLPGLQTEIKPWYSAMDIFMMSSEFEGMPLALLEAMSMECAVVSTDAGGIREVIRHERDGLLVNVSEWRQLETQLDKLCSHELLRKQLSGAGRKRVESNFSLRKMVDTLEEMYNGCRLPVTGYQLPVTSNLSAEQK